MRFRRIERIERIKRIKRIKRPAKAAKPRLFDQSTVERVCYATVSLAAPSPRGPLLHARKTAHARTNSPW
jgi:hypothetical protein